MNGKEMVKLYKSRGWSIDRIQGSHYVMKKGSMIEVIPVHGSRDLPIGLERKLITRLTKEEIEVR